VKGKDLKADMDPSPRAKDAGDSGFQKISQHSAIHTPLSERGSFLTMMQG